MTRLNLDVKEVLNINKKEDVAKRILEEDIEE